MCLVLSVPPAAIAADGWMAVCDEQYADASGQTRLRISVPNTNQKSRQ